MSVSGGAHSAQRAGNVILFLSLALFARALERFVPRWLAWRVRVPNSYTGMLTAATLLLAALVIPVPVFMHRARNKSRRHRFVLYGLWLLLMAGLLITLALETRASS